MAQRGIGRAMKSVYNVLLAEDRPYAYGVPMCLWYHDWDLRPRLTDVISDAIHITIVWPEQ